MSDIKGELYCSLPNPRNVHFESTNMENVLHWLAPEGVGDGVLYNVKYSVYGVGKWIRKPECRNINRTWCDLSSETADHEEQYYASVKAFLNGKCSNWIETTRFNPLTDIYPGLQYNVSVLKKKTKKRVWHYTDKYKEKVFIPCEKIVVNLITINVDEYKQSQESIHPSEMKSPRYYTVYSGTEEGDLSLKEVPETKHLLDIPHEDMSQEEDILVEQDKIETKNTLIQKNGGSIEYELGVRTEDFSPGQNLEELSLKEKASAPGGLGVPQTTLGNLVNIKTGKTYCPQVEVRATDPSLGQKLEELKPKMADAVDELLGKTLTKLVDSDAETSGQTSYHQLEKIAHGITEKESEQTILVDWDPHTGRLYIPTLFSVENEVCKGVFKRDDPNKEGILSRLYEKQVSEESSEDQETYLLQFQEQWGLHIEMED
ncbi:UNVERIFIED_CONTAM: hypothetical protein H355_004330 [Colinus virginianus]|nr:hypothetical protein H355_004330 [Colinus virginianus]